MPTFPQHRNMKKSSQAKEIREPENPVTDQTNNLPAISDLVSFEDTISEFECEYLTSISFHRISPKLIRVIDLRF